MTKKEKRHNAQQALVRGYLKKLTGKADKYGLGGWIRNIIRLNRRNECEATDKETHLLARMVNEERIARKDIPALFGISYRKAVDSQVFEKLKNLGPVGTYSKVSAIVESEVYDG